MTCECKSNKQKIQQGFQREILKHEEKGKWQQSTCTPLLARNCLKSAILMSPTRTDLCGGAGVERGSKDNMPFSVFPTSASTQATSYSPSCNYHITRGKGGGGVWRRETHTNTQIQPSEFCAKFG